MDNDQITLSIRGLTNFQHITKVLSEGFDDNLPNVLLYGSKQGIPHTILWDAAVQSKYGVFRRNTCIWNKQWTYQETPFFFDIDLAHPSQPKDISTLSDFLKEIVVHTCMHAVRHVFFLRNIDSVCAKNGSSMLRVMFERYASTAWFVCSTYKLGVLEPPIRSRFFTLRVPMPSEHDIESMFRSMDMETPEACSRHHVTNFSLALLIASIEPHHEKLPHTLDDVCCFHAPFLVDAIRSNSQPSMDDVRNLTQKLVAHGYTIAEVTQDLLATDSVIKPSKRSAFLAFSAHVDHMCSKTERFRKSLFMEWLLSVAWFEVDPPSPLLGI